MIHLFTCNESLVNVSAMILLWQAAIYFLRDDCKEYGCLIKINQDVFLRFINYSHSCLLAFDK